MHSPQRWFFPINLPQPPSCPVCGTALQPRTLVFWHSIAICALCESAPDDHLIPSLIPLAHKTLIPHTSHQYGLVFYHPPTENKPAIDLLAQLTHSIPVYDWDKMKMLLTNGFPDIPNCT